MSLSLIFTIVPRSPPLLQDVMKYELKIERFPSCLYILKALPSCHTRKSPDAFIITVTDVDTPDIDNTI